MAEKDIYSYFPTQKFEETVAFVVGAPRSGTTWLQALLSEHPGVVTTGESHLFSGYLGPWQKRYEFEGNKDKPDLGLAILLNSAEMLTIHRSVAYAVMDKVHSKDRSASVILDKTPNHVLHGKLILDVFPNAKFIHLVRDPRAVIASMIAAGRSWGSGWAAKGAYDASLEWIRHIDAACEIESATDHYRCIHYEALKTDGAKLLPSLFKFIGLPSTLEDCETYYDNCRFDAQKRSSKTTPRGFFRSGRIDAWRGDLSRSEVRTVEYLTQRQLQGLGYKLSQKVSRIQPARILLRRLLSKIETAARYVEDRL